MDASLQVRELEADDISLIADYWLLSNPDFLVSMGVDLQKLPTREGLTQMLTQQLKAPLSEKNSYALIWLADGKPVGHCSVNNIQFGQSANMHLHLWQSENRQRGMGTELVRKSLPFFFENLQLQKLYCEPYALNAAPNKTLEKLGFTFEKRYLTVPGSINFEQEVNRWKITLKDYQRICAEPQS